MKRYLSYIILIFLLVSLVSSFAACNGDNNPEIDVNDDYETYDEPPAIIKMFMSDSGIIVPEDIEVDNNKYINLIEQKFNVDIIIDKPDYQDFQLKYYLLLASSDLPDIIHTLYINLRRLGVNSKT